MRIAKILLCGLIWPLLCCMDIAFAPQDKKEIHWLIVGIFEWIVLVGIFLILFFFVWHEIWWIAVCVTLGGYLGSVFVIALVGVIHDLITRSSQRNEEYRHQEEK